jgi:hypothetical protein
MRIAHICPSLHEITGRLADPGLPAAGMVIVHPDFARRIDLPGAGLCARPIDIDRSRTGFVDLVSLRVYSFVAGMVIDGLAEDDEVFIVAMDGKAAITVTPDGDQAEAFSLQRDDGSRAIYMPPRAAYRLTAITDCDIAYARVQPLTAQVPRARAFSAGAGGLEITDYATAMDLALCMVRAGEHLERSRDDALPERFVHVRSRNGLVATLNGDTVEDWSSATLDQGGDMMLAVAAGAAEVLIIAASTGRKQGSRGETGIP